MQTEVIHKERQNYLLNYSKLILEDVPPYVVYSGSYSDSFLCQDEGNDKSVAVKGAATEGHMEWVNLNENTVWGGLSGFNPLGDLYSRRSKILTGLACGSTMTYFHNNAALRFEQFANEVVEDCIMVSSLDVIAAHHSYLRIIALGEKAIPLLIEKLDETPVFWFKALEAISGKNPVKKENRGDIRKMVFDWKNWAITNNYVSYPTRRTSTY